MIQLIHGPDTTNSRNLLFRLKEKQKYVLLNAREEKANLEQVLSQDSLFSPDLIIIDWCEEKDLPKTFPKNTELIIWSAQNLKETSWADKIHFFPLKTVSIFKLTDNFGWRQKTLSQEYLNLCLTEKNPPEVILSLLTRQLKQISLALDGKAEAASKSAFVRNKIEDQAKLWTPVGIKKAFRFLLEADLALKNGLNPKLVLSLALAKTNP